MSMPRWSGEQLFTPKQLKQARALWQHDRSHFHERAVKEVVLKAMPRIDQLTGQRNDASYFAYVLEYLIGQENDHA
jgi:hypothetical protein